MSFRQEHRRARTIYRIDRLMQSGEVYEYYGAEVYDTLKEAKAAATKRYRLYIDQITIVAVHEPACDILVWNG